MKRNYIVGNRKIVIIGTGYVGSSIAYALTLRNIAREVILIDINRDRALGEAHDIRHGISSMGTLDLRDGGYEECADCDLIIITAGRGRRPGESRLDLANENTKILKSVVEKIKTYYTRGVILIVSNPVDVLTFKVTEWMRLPDGMVFGTGCLLDTSRMIRSLSDYLGLSTGVISGYIVGEHGDNQIPIWSRVTVGDIPIEEYCNNVGIYWNRDIRNEISMQTKTMGTEIIKAKGQTHYGIATCVCYLADAIINQRSIIASVSSCLQGEHGARDIALSVPSVIGASGVQLRIREKWTPNEYRSFFDAMEKLRLVLSKIDA